MILIVMFKTPFYDYDEKAARSFSPYSLMIDSIVSYSLPDEYGTGFPIAVPVIVVLKDLLGRVRYTTVCTYDYGVN